MYISLVEKMLGVLGGFIPDNLLGPFAQKNVTKNVKENPMKYWPHFSWVKLYFFPHFPKSSWVNPTIFMGVTTHPHLLRKASASRRAMEGTEDASNGMVVDCPQQSSTVPPPLPPEVHYRVSRLQSPHFLYLPRAHACFWAVILTKPNGWL